MKLRIENVGKIKSADILLNGLTVIAGINDMGKSTVGKVLFATTKALALSARRGIDDKVYRLNKPLTALYERIGELRYTSRTLNSLLPVTIGSLAQFLINLPDTKEIDDFLNRTIKAIYETDLTPRIKSLCAKDLNNIRIILTENAQVADLYAEINSWIEMEFLNKFNSIGCDSSRVSLSMDDAEMVRFEYEVKNNQTEKTTLSSQDIFLDDATYIESPLYLHMLRTINSAKLYVEATNSLSIKGMLPMHVKDFSEKLTSTGMGLSQRLTSGFINDLNIDEVMNGKFSFDPTTGNLVFSRGEDTFPAVNVASGLKCFGVLRLLIENKIIDENRILIWDEPENHLHPEWQLNLAEVLVQLCKAGFPILISTHSPYFLQSIRFYAAKYAQEKYVNYYMSELDNDSNLQVFRNVTETLNDVFIKLAEPLNRVMNVDEVRKERKHEL